MMRRILSAIVCGGVLLAGCATAEAADGKDLFAHNCGICHREGGTGTFMLGRRLGEQKSLLEKRQDLNADLIRQVVRHGIVSMPRFSRVEVTDSDLAAIVTYLTAPKKAGAP
jgi:mono/diheme cytochrome c family protein